MMHELDKEGILFVGAKDVFAAEPLGFVGPLACTPTGSEGLVSVTLCHPWTAFRVHYNIQFFEKSYCL